jgi:beta-galactosidase/beta-glucuronidase
MVTTQAAPSEPGTDPQAESHPRPQLTRPEWTSLCGTWEFAYDDEGLGLTEAWQTRRKTFDREIEVPFPPESVASGIGDTGFHPVVWYRRQFERRFRRGWRVHLHFGAVDYRAQVWVNGSLVASHEGGHVPFSADITAALDPSGTQTVVVRAEDLPHDLTQPRGKQDWQLEPHAIWYSRTTGIWQPVWLEDVPRTHVHKVRWLPDIDRHSLNLTVGVAHAEQPDLRLRVVLRQSEKIFADDVYAVVGEDTEREIVLRESALAAGRTRLLWSPEQPNLIDATLTLLDGEDNVIDEVASYTALRSISAAHDRILLNGRPYYFRLVLAQNFWPDSHLAAPSDAALRREVELVKELGFNGVRLHQKIEDPRFLAWCDRLGLAVWAEMPAAYEFGDATVQRVTREWLDVLDRDVNHPCVIAWVPINESWGVPALVQSPQQQAFVRSLYHLTKSLDPYRLVIGNDGWEQTVTDILTVHDYASRGETLTKRYGDRSAVERMLLDTQPHYRTVLLPGAVRNGEPVLVSEFGGITYEPAAEHGKAWRYYGSVATPEALLRGFTELVGALIDSEAIAGFCWTQLTDTMQERNGLLTERREPKVDPAAIRQVNSRPSAAIPGDAINEFAYGDYRGAPTDGLAHRSKGASD